MSVKVKCVHCGELVNEFETDCPKCGKPVANKDAPTNVSEAPWKMSKQSQKKQSPMIPVIIILLIGAAAAAVYFLKFK